MKKVITVFPDLVNMINPRVQKSQQNQGGIKLKKTTAIAEKTRDEKGILKVAEKNKNTHFVKKKKHTNNFSTVAMEDRPWRGISKVEIVFQLHLFKTKAK